MLLQFVIVKKPIEFWFVSTMNFVLCESLRVKPVNYWVWWVN